MYYITLFLTSDYFAGNPRTYYISDHSLISILNNYQLQFYCSLCFKSIFLYWNSFCFLTPNPSLQHLQILYPYFGFQFDMQTLISTSEISIQCYLNITIYRMLPTPIKLAALNQSSSPYLSLNHPSKTPDIFFYLQGQLIPASRSKLASHGLFTQEISKKQKLIFINESINLPMFQTVINFFHGFPLQLKTFQQLAACLDVLDFVQARQLIQDIQQCIECQVQAYDIFCIMDLAFRYGMQNIFDICLRYLQYDQFEQINYNKFDLLQCDFKLFQIVLRKHHILKMREQIQGISVQDVEEVIRMYCQRHHFDNVTLKRLLDKYVVNLEKYDKLKVPLKLDNYAKKEILQSANIDTQFFDNEDEEDYREMLKSPSVRYHKYCIQMRQQERIISQSKFKDVFLTQIKQPEVESIVRDSSDNFDNSNDSVNKSEYQIRIESVDKESRSPLDANQDKRQKQEKVKGKDYCVYESDVAVSKLHGMLNLFEQALHEHDTKYKNVRRNSKSLFVEDFTNNSDILLKARLQNSSNLNGVNRLFTIYEPKS